LHGKILECQGDKAKICTDEGVKAAGRCNWSPREDADAVLVIRPEKVLISEENRLDNMLPGIIEEVIYMGEAIVYRIIIEGGENIRLKRPNLSTGMKGGVNDKVFVGWEVADAAVLPVDDEEL
jgi:ABC-type Fe3+/spermidine/putrescine transport system ATPase subunit